MHIFFLLCLIDFILLWIHHHILSINGTTLKRVISFRFLRVQISKDLTWTQHIDTITNSPTAAVLLPQAAEAQHGLQDTLQLPQVHQG